MILSKGNLRIVDITKTDKQIPALDTVHITKEGGTVVTNGMAIICVSPVSKEMKEKVVLTENCMFTDETIASETAKEVLKNMPKDSKFRGILEHCDYASGQFELTDGKRNRSISSKTYPREYVDYQNILKSAHRGITSVRCAVNLKRLLVLLDCIDKVCPDSAKNSAVFLEFTEDNDIFIRAKNQATEQKVLAFMKAYDTQEIEYAKYDEWESKLLGVIPKRKIKKVMKPNHSLRDLNLTCKEKSLREERELKQWKNKTKRKLRKNKKNN